MTTRLSKALLGVAVVVAIAAASGSAATLSPRITEAGGAVFPGRAYVLTLPHGMQLKPGAVSVKENGNDVNGLTVTPVGGSTSQQFGAVLAVDASTSMEGKPERAAFEAARAFAAQRKSTQQLAIVTYNVTPTTALPLTNDGKKIDAALTHQPTFVYGTHIYDAVMHSLEILRAEHINAGTIILLSDGQEARGRNDNVPHATEPVAAAAARSAHVRVFTVGLRSRLANLGVLKALAHDTGGRYVEAKSLASLSTIYNELGSELASDYLVQYRSLAGPGKRIDVAVTVAGLEGQATAGYETPKLTILKPPPHAPYDVSLAHRIWTSAFTMVVIGLIVAVLVGAGAGVLVAGPRGGTVRERLAEFVSVPSALQGARRRPTAQVTEKMLEGTHSLLRNATWLQRFRWELQVAAISTPPEQIIMLCVIGAIVMLALVKFVTNSTLFAIASALVIPFGARAYIKRQLNRRRSMFAEQLPDNLQVLASALRAGHSFIGALSVVVNDAPEPARSEFQRVVADEQLGVPVDESLRVVVQRMDNRDLEQVSLVAALQHQTGGNTAEVLDRVTDTIREKFELRRTVRTLTAQGRMSRWVLTLLPLFLFLVINLLNPSYVGQLYHTTLGKVMLVLAAIAVSSGSFVIKRIVNIKV